MKNFFIGEYLCLFKGQIFNLIAKLSQPAPE